MTDAIEVDGVIIAFTEEAYRKAIGDQRRFVESHERRSALMKENKDE